MIPSRTLLALAAVVALANAAGCKKSESVAHAAPPPSFPSTLEALPAPGPAPTAGVAAPAEQAKPADEKPTAAEVAAIEHPHIAK